MTRWSLPAILALIGVGLALPGRAEAHLGPPFPVLVDQPIPGYLVTVLTNPDIGQAVVYVVLEPDKSGAHGPVSDVEVWIQPVSKRVPPVFTRADQQFSRGSLRFYAQPPFDAIELWYLGVDIRLGDGTVHHLVTPVKATPPGIGPWGLLLFLFPFLLFGGLWVAVFVRRSRLRAMRAAAAGCVRDSVTGA